MELHWLPERLDRLLGRIAACSAAERVRAPREKSPRGVGALGPLWEVTILPVLDIEAAQDTPLPPSPLTDTVYRDSKPRTVCVYNHTMCRVCRVSRLHLSHGPDIRR